MKRGAFSVPVFAVNVVTTGPVVVTQVGTQFALTV